MSSNGYKFVGCQHCWERDNITYNDEYAGREFARRVTETGYRNGEQSISFDSDCEIENEGEADFDGSDFESSDDGWDYGEITCNYCGYEVSSYYKTNLIALWQDDDHETIVEYNAQDDEDDEDEAVTPESEGHGKASRDKRRGSRRAGRGRGT